MPKQGFNNQWIAIARTGKFADATNIERDLNEDFLRAVVGNFTAHNAPAVIGHPQDNNPAFGWVSALRLKDGVLEARFSDTDETFEQMCSEGRFRKRSASFYMEPAALRHVGFLGAVPPAVKGLPDIQFNDGARAAVEISFNFNEENSMDKQEENTQEDKKTFGEWLKEVLGGGGAGGQQPAPAPANFSEAQAQNLIESAVKKATDAITADFTEKLSAKDTVIESLSKQVSGISTSGQRAEIASFVESIPAEKGRHFLKGAGIAEFMETLATDDAADTENAIVCFSEGDDGKRTEVKMSRVEWFKNYVNALPAFISFGESFGNLKASAEADTMVKAEDLSELRGAMGVSTAANAGGAK
jgi:hypothetical protein